MSQPKKSKWTKQVDAELTRLVGEGCSAGQIANALALDLTRNAVIGRCNRLKLHLHGSNGGGGTRRKHRQKPKLLVWSDPVPVKRAVVVEEEVPTKDQIKYACEIAEDERKSWEDVGLVPPQVPEPVSPRPTETACTIYELKRDSCRYPLWDSREVEKFYCGATAAGTYCDEHDALTSRPFFRTR